MSVSLAKPPVIPARDAEGYVIESDGDRLNVQRVQILADGQAWLFASVLDAQDFTVDYRSLLLPPGRACALSAVQLVPADDWELV